MKKNNTLKFIQKIQKNKRTKKTKLSGGSINYSSTSNSSNSISKQLINTVIIFYEALFIQSINMISKVIGIDISDPQQLHNQLNNIKNILSNPQLQSEVYTIVEKLVVVGGIFYDVLKPHMNNILEELNKTLEKSGSKLATTIEKIIINISKGIPLWGILIAILDSATIAANTNTYIEEQKLSFYKTLAETWQKMKPDYDRLLNTLNSVPSIQNQLNKY